MSVAESPIGVEVVLVVAGIWIAEVLHQLTSRQLLRLCSLSVDDVIHL